MIPRARRLAVLMLVGLVARALSSPATAQEFVPNYDESQVPEYTLPDPLRTTNGVKVESPEQWVEARRPELLKLFETQVYGVMPPPPEGLHFEELSIDRDALGGKATRKQVRVHFADHPAAPPMDVLLYVPNSGTGPYPAFLGLNFGGNHTIHPDPGILLNANWIRNNPASGVVENRATDASRGSASSRWPVERIIDRGYALATVYYGDIDPDFDDGFRNGIHVLTREQDNAANGERKPDAWGSIGAWAWGLSRALDYLQTDQEIDPRRVAVMGHSRLGKTSLWAGATDPRFALVVSNNSGCGGAALSRRAVGETVWRINTAFPHWFCDNFNQYNNNEAALPVDQHELIALIAPRPVLVCSAAEDLWADPRGEFLAAKGADPVYRLLGTDGLAVGAMPAVGDQVLSTIGYRIRPGEHDVKPEDWEAYMDFADKHLRAAE